MSIHQRKQTAKDDAWLSTSNAICEAERLLNLLNPGDPDREKVSACVKSLREGLAHLKSTKIRAPYAEVSSLH